MSDHSVSTLTITTLFKELLLFSLHLRAWTLAKLRQTYEVMPRVHARGKRAVRDTPPSRTREKSIGYEDLIQIVCVMADNSRTCSYL